MALRSRESIAHTNVWEYTMTVCQECEALVIFKEKKTHSWVEEDGGDFEAFRKKNGIL